MATNNYYTYGNAQYAAAANASAAYQQQQQQQPAGVVFSTGSGVPLGTAAPSYSTHAVAAVLNPTMGGLGAGPTASLVTPSYSAQAAQQRSVFEAIAPVTITYPAGTAPTVVSTTPATAASYDYTGYAAAARAAAVAAVGSASGAVAYDSPKTYYQAATPVQQHSVTHHHHQQQQTWPSHTVSSYAAAVAAATANTTRHVGLTSAAISAVKPVYSTGYGVAAAPVDQTPAISTVASAVTSPQVGNRSSKISNPGSATFPGTYNGSSISSAASQSHANVTSGSTGYYSTNVPHKQQIQSNSTVSIDAASSSSGKKVPATQHVGYSVNYTSGSGGAKSTAPVINSSQTGQQSVTSNSGASNSYNTITSVSGVGDGLNRSRVGMPAQSGYGYVAAPSATRMAPPPPPHHYSKPMTPSGISTVGSGAGGVGGNPYDAALFSAAASMYMNQNPRASLPPGMKMGHQPGHPQMMGGGMASGVFGAGRRPGLGSQSMSSNTVKFRTYRPPKQQQLHYCDVCKISCAGPSAYNDHLQGQRHKKKVTKPKTVESNKSATSATSGTTTSSTTAGTTVDACTSGAATASTNSTSTAGSSATTAPVFLCELCDVECTAADAYAAHLRGSKHTKVEKLHTRLGKPIPVTVDQAKNKLAAVSSASGSNAKSSSNTNPANSTDTSDATTENGILLVDDRPAVGSDYIEEEKDATTGRLLNYVCKLCDCKFSDPNAKEMHMKGRKHRLQFKKKVDPKLKVEMKPNNLKNKRNERWKKQNSSPNAVSTLSPSSCLASEKQSLLHKGDRHKDFRRLDEKPLESHRFVWEQECRRYEAELKDYVEWYRNSNSGSFGGTAGQMRSTSMLRSGMLGGTRLIPPPSSLTSAFVLGASPLHLQGLPGPTGMLARKFESFDDRHVFARHKAIHPSHTDLGNIQHFVAIVEKALKRVSDYFLSQESDQPAQNIQKENEKGAEAVRELVGVLRVGIIAKGLVLADDNAIDLVMLCNQKPTMSLLNRILVLLPDYLKDVTKERDSNADWVGSDYKITARPADAALVVSCALRSASVPRAQDGDKESEVNSTQPERRIEVKVTLTSTVIREEIMARDNPDKQRAPDNNDKDKNNETKDDPPDVLSKTKCLEALAALRHAKWFQARAATVHNCLITIRILRDLCKREQTWAPFNTWAMELLCEKVLSWSSTHGQQQPLMGMQQPVLSPGDAVRRVFQAIASGILLPGGPGLLDPCEKDPVDAVAYLTGQQREDITASAQHMLRQIAFRQIYKVLGMEASLPSPSTSSSGGSPRFRNTLQSFYTRKRRRENSVGRNKNEGVDGKKDKKDGSTGEDHEEPGADDGAHEQRQEKMEITSNGCSRR